MKIREILRTAHVTRWHIVRTHRQQTVAEHHYLVVMLARDMAKIIGIKNPVDLNMLTEWCLIHDTPEVLTGDLPTLTKLEIKKHLDFDDVIEGQVSQDYARMRAVVKGTPIETLAKLADMMEGIIFLRNEGVRVDDPTTHTYQVFTGITQAYRRAVTEAHQKHPDYAWHLLYDYREEIDESPVRDLRNVVRPDRH